MVLGDCESSLPRHEVLSIPGVSFQGFNLFIYFFFWETVTKDRDRRQQTGLQNLPQLHFERLKCRPWMPVKMSKDLLHQNEYMCLQPDTLLSYLIV